MTTKVFTGTNGTSVPADDSAFITVGSVANCQIQNNTAVGTVSGISVNALNESRASAHFCKAISHADQDGAAGVAIRIQTSTGECYYAHRYPNDGRIYAGQYISGEATDWDSGYLGSAAGDEFELRIDSSVTTTIRLLVEGVVVTTFTGKNALSGGMAGVMAFGSTGNLGVTQIETGDTPADGTSVAISGSASTGGAGSAGTNRDNTPTGSGVTVGSGTQSPVMLVPL